VVEDNPINLEVAVGMLESLGCVTQTANNGRMAIEAMNGGAYDAVLMDCQMPEMNGFEATTAIRAMKNSVRFTPIIGVTAGARDEDRQRCLATGMDAYLSKPVDKDALLALVAHSVKHGSAKNPPAAA
jgi:CheY-like chemotaxis protein